MSDPMTDLIERLRAATMGFDWSDLPDDALIPAVPLLREAANRIASLEAERDDARRQRDEIGRAWDEADARAKEAEARAARLETALAEARADVHSLCSIGDGLVGWISTAEATDNVAKWQMETIRCAARATGQDAGSALGDFRRAALSSSKQKDGE